MHEQELTVNQPGEPSIVMPESADIEAKEREFAPLFTWLDDQQWIGIDEISPIWSNLVNGRAPSVSRLIGLNQAAGVIYESSEGRGKYDAVVFVPQQYGDLATRFAGLSTDEQRRLMGAHEGRRLNNDKIREDWVSMYRYAPLTELTDSLRG